MECAVCPNPTMRRKLEAKQEGIREISHFTDNQQRGWQHVNVKQSKSNIGADKHSPANDRYELCERVIHRHTIHTRAHTISIPNSIPHLDLWAQPRRLLSTRERNTYLAAFWSTHTHSHKPMLPPMSRWNEVGKQIDMLVANRRSAKQWF